MIFFIPLPGRYVDTMNMSLVRHVRFLPTLLLAVLLSVGFTACQEEEKKLVCFRMPITDEWGTQMVQEMAYEAAKHPDIQLEVSYVLPGEGASEYLEFLEQCMQRNAKAIIVYPYYDVLKTYIQRAMNEGIGVVVVRTDESRNCKYSACVRHKNYELGRQIGRDVASQYTGDVNVLELFGIDGVTRCTRSLAFHEVVDTIPRIHVLDTLGAIYNKGRAYEMVRKFLKTCDKPIDLVVAMNDRMALGARMAIEQDPRSRKWNTRYMGVDALYNDSIGIGRVEDGSIDVTYYYPTGGKEAMQAAASIVHGEPYKLEKVLESMRVTRSNVSMLRAQYAKERRQYELSRDSQFRVERQKHDYAMLKTMVLLLALCLIFSAMLIVWLLLQSRSKNGKLTSMEQQLQFANQQFIECQRERAVLETKCEQLEADRDRWIVAANTSSDGVATEEDLRDFRTRVLSLIRTQMGDDMFNVDQLADQLCVSRSKLYRQISTDFEMTPADLLRTMRMELAERLLKTSQLTVAEVAYKVGFTSHKYFSRCFKDHFGVAPTDVRRQGRAEAEETAN